MLCQAREAEREALGGCRLELESLRLLLERLGRREILKRKGALPSWAAVLHYCES